VPDIDIEIRSTWWEYQALPEEVQTVREVVDMANAAERDRHSENYAKSLPADTLFPDL